MPVHLYKLTAAMAIALFGSGSARAQDAPSSIFSVSGYGTFGLVHSSESQADFIPQTNPKSGAGYSSSTSAAPDTRVGLQVDAKFSDKLSGVVQIVSEMERSGSYEPQLAVANVKYKVTPAFDISAGRFLAPIYMLSDSVRIGYAFPWVRPPSEVYYITFPLQGVEARYRFSAGGVAVTTQAFYGSTNTTLFNVHGETGINVQADLGASSLRIGYSAGSLDLKNAQLTSLLNYYRPTFAALANQYEVKGDPSQFAEIGYSYDPGSWFFRSEVIRNMGDKNLLRKNTSMYGSAGVRVGRFTPYATLARVKDDGPRTIGNADPLGIINSVLAANNTASKSLTLGTRWDFRANTDFKIEVAHVKNGAGSNGGLQNIQPGFVPGQGYNLISASIDFVF